MKKIAFTLAEVLITLGIIGVIAAITLSVVINKIRDMQYKAAYKKAYSDISQVFQMAKDADEISYRERNDIEATTSEYDILKKYLKVTHSCSSGNRIDCWAIGDTVGSEYQAPQASYNKPFIDAAGRSWSNYNRQESIWLVDINGLKGPNKFGKDRFVFGFANSDNRREGNLTKVQIMDDQLVKSWCCQYPPCYYKSWLYK